MHRLFFDPLPTSNRKGGVDQNMEHWVIPSYIMKVINTGSTNEIQLKKWHLLGKIDKNRTEVIVRYQE